jgi:hypothetical protein
MVVAAVLPGVPAAVAAITGIGIAGLGSVVYSYFAWRQEARQA